MKNCVKCKKEFDDSYNFCPHCGNVYKTNPPMSTTAITKIEDISSLLTNLQSSANESLSAALTAQLQVVRYIQTPELIGSTFDILLQNTKKAIKCANSDMLREQIRERTALMINNYIFFMQAKLDAQYMILQEDNKKSRENARQLISEAAEMLSDSIEGIAALAGTEGVSKTPALKAEITKVVVNQIFTKQNEKKKSFFGRVVDWFCQEDRQIERELEHEEQLNDFYKVLEEVFEKLERRKNTIGRNDLIAELINRYKYPIISQWQRAIEHNNDIFSDRCKTIGKYCAIAIGASLFLQLLILFVRWIYRLIASIFTTLEGGWATQQWHIFLIVLGSIVGLTAIAYIAIIGTVIYHNSRLKKSKAENYERLTAIQKHFEEYDLDID